MSQYDDERSALLLQQEGLTKSIAATREKLNRFGTRLGDIGGSLKTSPQSIGFANAPPPYAISAASADNIFDWNDIPTREAIAELVHQLQEDEFKLANVRRQLR